MGEFKIDFFELCFLSEACIPPVPIGRGVFWEKLINNYFFLLTYQQKDNLFDWIVKNPKFNLENEDCKWFNDRFNPDNQYSVKTLYNGKEEINNCFLHDGKYHINITQSIYEKHIIEVNKK